MKMWVSDSRQELEISIPLLGRYRPAAGRCCQTCTPKSWDGLYDQQLSSLGFRDVVRVTEKDTRYRGWLVRRICGFLAAWGWKIPADTPRDLPARICRSKRVRDVAGGQSRSSRGAGRSPRGWKEKVLRILAEIQAPLAPLLLRLSHWALLKFLSRLFLSVQLHRGQLKMVLQAAGTPSLPLVFLSVHRSQLDGLLLSFLLFSQGLGVPRVTMSGRPYSPLLRAFLSRLGGIFLPAKPPSDWDEELSGAVLATYVREVLRSRQPLLIFLEEPQVTLQLSAAAQQWLALVYEAVRDGTIPDVLLVPVGIGYDVVPDRLPREGEDVGPLGLGACLWAGCWALRRRFGSVRVDFAQPFSLQEFVAKSLSRPSPAGKQLDELLLPSILGTSPSQREDKKVSAAAAEETVVELGLHSLSAGVACSAVTAVGITSALLLYKHREGVFLSRLMLDFSWLLDEILLRQRDVAFSGQLRAVVLHSLVLLAPHLALYRLAPLGDVLVVPRGSAEARRELAQHSAAILPVFACEAVGACAVRALLLEMLPLMGATVDPSGIVMSQDELLLKTLELLHLLPSNLLGLKPCQTLDSQSQDIVDKLLLCGLLEAEEESERWVCDLGPWPFCRGQPWAGTGFSDSEDEDEAPKRCFKLGKPQGSPGFLLFLCRLLSPVLGTYARAAAFLQQPHWPQPKAAYVEALLQFLAQEGGLEHPNLPAMALGSLQTFTALGVLEETQSPSGPRLQLAPSFSRAVSLGKLEAFLRQLAQP